MSQSPVTAARLASPARPAAAGRGSSRDRYSSGAENPFSLLPSDAQWRACDGPNAGDPVRILPLLNYVIGSEAGFLFGFEGDSLTGLKPADRSRSVQGMTAEKEKHVLSCVERRFEGKQEVGTALAASIEELSLQAATTARFASRAIRCAAGKFLLVAVPFLLSEKKMVCLAVAVSNRPPSEAKTIASVVQGQGWWLTQAAVSERLHREVAIFERVTGFLDLLKRCSEAGDAEEVSSIQANLLREILGCESVSVVGLKSGQFRCLASSGGEETLGRSEGGTAIERAVAEASRRGESIARGPNEVQTKRDRHDVCREFVRLFDATGWVVVPIESDEVRLGGWVCLWSEEDDAFAEKKQFLEASALEAAPIFRLLRATKPSGIRATVHRIWKRLGQSQKRLVLTFLIGLLGVGFVPLRERCEAPLNLEPTVRRIIAAPFDSTLRLTEAEAGDLVSEGDVLARLDGREVRFALVEAIANRTRAEKEADRALDAGKVAEAQMAQLEAESHAQQQQLNEAKQERLEVRSPIKGLVLQGDLERAEGTPLRTGDRLFEIAPIDSLLVEVALPESEISRVRVGMPVRIKLEAYPGETLEAELTRVPLRSEIRDGQNVFVCEATIENHDERFRPGMKGEAKVLGDRTFLLWTILRPAVNYVRLKLWF
ncbi:MAG: efflux RND transporter periplasmic adaptor subunit [Verrucomicrobiota bacterium]